MFVYLFTVELDTIAIVVVIRETYILRVEVVVKRLSLQQNMILNTCGSMIRLVCNWLLTVAVVRLSHGFDAAGVLSLSMSVCNMVIPFAEYRLRTIHVTDVSGERSVGEYLGLRIITMLSSFVGGVVYSALTCTMTALPVISMYLVSQLVATYLEGLHAVDQRAMRMDYIGISYALQGVFGLVAFCVALLLTNSLLLAASGLLAVNVAVGLFWDIPKTRQFCSLRPVIKLRVAANTLVRLFPIVMATVCASAVITVPRQYLAVSLGASALGIYSSVASPTTVVQVGAQFIYTPLLGTFAEKYNKDKRSAKRLIERVVVGIVFVGVACIALFAVFGRFALELFFGADMADYSLLLIPAVLCTFVTGFSFFANDLLIAIRDYAASLAGNIAATAVSLLLSVPMVSVFGMNGVSYCGIAAYGTGAILMLVLLYRDYMRKA